jgi:hypothetical protein
MVAGNIVTLILILGALLITSLCCLSVVARRRS